MWPETTWRIKGIEAKHFYYSNNNYAPQVNYTLVQVSKRDVTSSLWQETFHGSDERYDAGDELLLESTHQII